jgi:secondary thiamine-phosphate synthase enzyme
MIFQEQFQITTRGRGFYNLDNHAKEMISKSGAACGICHLYIQHTSASLIISENADKTVLTDLENFMTRLIPDGDPLFKHVAEGIDDMPAHVRSLLTQTAVSIPIIHHQLGLGTWQGVFLWEHRLQAHRRQIVATIIY